MDAAVALWLVWSKWLGFKDKLKAAGTVYSWLTVDSGVVWCKRPGPCCERLPIALAAVRGRIAVNTNLMEQILLQS